MALTPSPMPTDPPLAPPGDLVDALHRCVPQERVLTRTLERVAFASDASFYRLMPEAVVFPSSVDEVQRLFALSRSRGIPLTFRAAGTSLSGPVAVRRTPGGGGTALARRGSRKAGQRFARRPGMIGDHLNQLLRPFGRKIGPDPASIRACTLGGILANNSSGMCCGVEQNSYHTLRSLTFVLPVGHPHRHRRRRRRRGAPGREPALHTGLLALRDELRSRPALVERIRAKYRMKNTTGYGLNAFVDFERPVDIFAHLLIGSEGTLAFIAEAVMDTVPVLPTSRPGCSSSATSTRPAPPSAPSGMPGARALELLDSASLRAARRQAGHATRARPPRRRSRGTALRVPDGPGVRSSPR